MLFDIIEVKCGYCGSNQKLSQKSYRRNLRENKLRCRKCYNDDEYKKSQQTKSNNYWVSKKKPKTPNHVMHKKTLWDHASKMKLSEAEYAIQFGFIKIAGKEKFKYHFRRKISVNHESRGI